MADGDEHGDDFYNRQRNFAAKRAMLGPERKLPKHAVGILDAHYSVHASKSAERSYKSEKRRRPMTHEHIHLTPRNRGTG